ncbi:hypothetical protein FHR58_000076 [Xanthomonas arboricola]|nr:hypothetical protein [Xanthomonas arboricola]
MRAGLLFWCALLCCAQIRCDQAGCLSVDRPVASGAPMRPLQARLRTHDVRAKMPKQQAGWRRCTFAAWSQHRATDQLQAWTGQPQVSTATSARKKPPRSTTTSNAMLSHGGASNGRSGSRSQCRSAARAIRRPLKDTCAALAGRKPIGRSQQAGCARSAWPKGAPALGLRRPVTSAGNRPHARQARPTWQQKATSISAPGRSGASC